MPKSEKNNSTIENRYNSYTQSYKESNGLTDISRFVKEINDGKEFLNKYGNDYREHDILCMWRVIILSKHCVVQSYFPNNKAGHSFMSPTFVFQKENADNSYYNTFLSMFDLIKAMGP